MQKRKFKGYENIICIKGIHLIFVSIEVCILYFSWEKSHVKKSLTKNVKMRQNFFWQA